MTNKAIELFKQGHWTEAADMIAKSRDGSQADQRVLTYLGLSYMKLGKYDAAESVFEKLTTPIPSLAASNWAGLLLIKGKYNEALKVLSKTHRSIQQGVLEEMIEADLCILMEDILSLIAGSCDLESMKLRKRDRLLKLMLPGVLLFSATYGMLGRIFKKLKFPNGELIQKFVENFRNQCWAYGFQIQPDFLERVCPLKEMKGFEDSLDVYNRIFLSYIKYWIDAKENTNDLLLASVKPPDAHALYCIVREKQPSVILEVGTFVGFSTSLMAQALKDNGKGKIYCIDPNLKHLSVKSPILHAKKMLESLQLDGYVEIHEGFFSEPRGGTDPDKPVLGKRISDIVPSVDLAFIDGDHATTAVLQDFMLVLPHMQKISTVLFHDIKSVYTVRQGILTFFQDNIYKYLFRYFEVAPSAIDGIGFIEIDKSRRIIKEGLDKLISGGL